MTSVLVTYGTGDGQTAKVAERIGAALRERGVDVTTRHVWDVGGVDVASYDGVLVGASVRSRRHQPEVLAFVQRNRDALADRPSGFFQLSFASAIASDWAREGAREWVDQFVDATGWRPDAVGCFGGAIRYSTYGPVTRQVFRLASALTTGDTDASRDYEYTDWEAVDAFAESFADLVEREREGPLGRPEARGTRRLLSAALVVVAVAAGAVWLTRRREASRQVTLDDVDRDRPRSTPPDEPPAASETLDAAVGSAHRSGGADGDDAESDS